MSYGKAIRIHLADGSVAGIRHGEIVNWTGQAIACSRAKFADLKEWPESRRPGVYFLFGVDETTGQDALYIGEAEIVLDRLGAHLTGKDFWNELIAFTSKDKNLTKAHVRYLEARLIAMANKAGRYQVTNGTAPQIPALPRADRDAMEEYIEHLRTLLGVLGHRVLEPLTTKVQKVFDIPVFSQISTVDQQRATDLQKDQVTFYLKAGTLNASAVRTDEGIVVLAGSEVAAAQTSLSGGYRLRREKLIATGVLVDINGTLRFSKDELFSSASQAGAIVAGYAVNGREVWRTSEGKTWADIEAETVLHLATEMALGEKSKADSTIANL